MLLRPLAIMAALQCFLRRMGVTCEEKCRARIVGIASDNSRRRIRQMHLIVNTGSAYLFAAELCPPTKSLALPTRKFIPFLDLPFPPHSDSNLSHLYYIGTADEGRTRGMMEIKKNHGVL
jgi:hypothetical protein